MPPIHSPSAVIAHEAEQPNILLRSEPQGSSTMQTPSFFAEDWYQPLDNGPTFWSVTCDVIRTAVNEVVNFFTKKRLKKESLLDPTAHRVVQAKPVYTLSDDGTPQPIWEPSPLAVSYNPFDETQTHTHTNATETDELTESKLIAPNADELNDLNDINAWIEANITAETTVAIEEDEVNNIASTVIAIESSEDDSVLETDCAEEIELADVNFTTGLDAVKEVEPVIVVTSGETEYTTATVKHSVKALSNEELEHLNQIQNKELNTLINQYFGSTL